MPYGMRTQGPRDNLFQICDAWGMSSGIKTRPNSVDLAVVWILDVERGRQGMTQVALAAEAGISQSQVSRVLGGIKPVTLTEMLRMCEALGLVASAVVEQAERDAL